MKKRYIAIVGLLGMILGCQPKQDNSFKKDSIAYRIDTLMAKMTLMEKIGQMNQYNGFMDFTGPQPEGGDEAKKLAHLKNGLVGSMINVYGAKEVKAVQDIAVHETRLGIPLIIGFDVIHGFKTISPIPLAEAASWDMEAIRKSAEMAAEEAASYGINWGFAPMVDISRDARWGRVMEGFGEDPFLGSEITKARVKGFQGDDLTKPNTIAASVKHFAGYGFSEGGRDYNTVDVGTSTLYNVIFPPFQAALEADVKTVMSSFNVVNGIPSTGNEFLQREILKERWGFQGFSVSDWGAITEMIAHGFAKDGRDAAKKALLAGMDMDMESYHYINALKQLVEDGEVDERLIDDAVQRILRVKFELGLFDDPYLYISEEREKDTSQKDEFQKLALDLARKSIVLLKNKDQLLPLKKEGQHIGIIGELANDKTSPLGNWRLAAEENGAVSVVEGFKDYPSTNKISFARGVSVVEGPTSFHNEVQINSTDTTGMAEAVSLARKVDVVVMVLGEHGLQSGEGRSRTDLDLPGLQKEMLKAVLEVNPKVVLVLQNGRPLTLSWEEAHVPAIVEGWHLGTQSGNAIAEVLYGDYNPSGKLPMSFPRHVGQMPLYYNHKSTGRPADPGDGVVFWSHYTDRENEALFPFGFGLSYTTFTYANLQVDNKYDEKGEIRVRVEVANVGEVKGKTTAQLYLWDKVARITRPVRSLKAFEQIELEAGEKQNVEFILNDKDLGFYDNEGEFIVEPGDFEVFIGEDSTADLSEKFSL